MYSVFAFVTKCRPDIDDLRAVRVRFWKIGVRVRTVLFCTQIIGVKGYVDMKVAVIGTGRSYEVAFIGRGNFTSTDVGIIFRPLCCYISVE